MSEAFIGEIRIFAGNFAPKNWATCDGQTLPIAQNTALFSLLGVQYGGNGTTVFQLPNLQGNLPVGMGNGPGLTPRLNGQAFGTTTETIGMNQMPSHTHTPAAGVGGAPTATPTGNYWGQVANLALYNTEINTPMNAGTVNTVGGGQPHNNLMPSLNLLFIIALFGVFPQRQ